MINKFSEFWRNSRIRVIVQLAFAIIVLIFLFEKINFSTLIQIFNQIRVIPLVFSLVITFLIRFLWAFQIYLTQRPFDLHLSVLNLFIIQLIASFYKLILPGDIVAGGVSWYKISQPTGKYVEAGSILIYFRLMYILTLVCIGLLFIWWDPQLASPTFRIASIVLLAVAILLLLPFYSPRVTTTILNLISKYRFGIITPSWLNKQTDVIFKSLEGFQSFGFQSTLFVLGLSFLSQLLGILNFYFLAISVGLMLPFSIIAWIRSFVLIIQMIPITIAGLGVREVSIVVLLSNYGISAEQAISYSLTIFAISIVVALIGGIFEGWDFFLKWRYVENPVIEKNESIEIINE